MDTFATDILKGLSSNPKFIPSKYFYDEKGSSLFEEIMDLPEYYLTRCEYEILSAGKDTLLKHFASNSTMFNLIDLGAGDGIKTKLLIEHFLKEKTDFCYVPIDISSDVINNLTAEIAFLYPGLFVRGIADDYFSALKHLRETGKGRNIVLFLGSNIGNFNKDESIEFLKSLRNALKQDDLALIGFDLKKNPRLILQAYNDSTGVTRAFNLNLLERINREFGADFNLLKFEHYPVYDPISGEARSYLISQTDQKIFISKLNTTIDFYKGEPLFTEISRKFSMEDIYSYAAEAGFHSVQYLFDSKKFFVNVLWRV